MIKIQTPNGGWQELQVIDFKIVGACRRCGSKFETDRREQLYCGRRCKVRASEDRKALLPTHG